MKLKYSETRMIGWKDLDIQLNNIEFPTLPLKDNIALITLRMKKLGA